MSEDQKPKDQPNPTGQPNPKAVEQNIKARLTELTNVNRIVTNGLNLIMDVDIKGGHAVPVAEFTNWLTGFVGSIQAQIKTLEATLPKKPESKIVPKAAEVPGGVAVKALKPVESVAKTIDTPDKTMTAPTK